MVFSSLPFLFLFLPAVLAGYFLIPQKFRDGRNLLLLVFSLGFYAYGGLWLLPVILISITINYSFGLLVGRQTREAKESKSAKTALFFGLAGNLGLLVWLKYAGFLAENINALGASLTVPDIILPIGISFYTFQGMSYLIDIYRGEAAAQRSFLRLALYIALFTQLVAGPIVRYSSIAHAIEQRKETLDDFSSGALRFLFGLAKKVLLANALGQVADAAFAVSAVELSTGFAWLGVAAYTMQIYFDFSGYSDMAIGLGRMFGLHFAENFNYPYVATSATEFWRRWHISLGSWFRDYLYVPLGGNRGGRGMHLRNLLLVWLLTGLWHGAAWNFIFWGLFYALLLIGERFLWGKPLARLPRPLQHMYALLAIMLGFVLFRSVDLGAALPYLQALFGLTPAPLWDGQATYYLIAFAPELVLGVFAALPVKNWLAAWLEAREAKPWARLLRHWGPPVLALALFALCVMRLLSSSFNPFIYFQF